MRGYISGFQKKEGKGRIACEIRNDKPLLQRKIY